MEFTQEQKFYGEIVQKAWEDAEFKTALIANPVEAIEKFSGKKLTLPEGKTLVVRDQTDNTTVYINIPAMPEVDAELNEKELEAVAGGCQLGDSGLGGGLGWPPPFDTNPIKDILISM